MRYERISADCHIDLCQLPPDLFTSNASAALKERMPYVTDSPKGKMWVSKNGGFFGLAGGETLAEAAARVTVSVEFLLQWDDELVWRDSGLALFGAFASREKTLHANPGRHAGVPAFELESSERFFTRHLLEGGAVGTAGEPPPRR